MSNEIIHLEQRVSYTLFISRKLIPFWLIRRVLGLTQLLKPQLYSLKVDCSTRLSLRLPISYIIHLFFQPKIVHPEVVDLHVSYIMLVPFSLIIILIIYKILGRLAKKGG